MSKKLVAYFSASGNTEKLAKSLAAAADAALYRIAPAVPYGKKDLDWMEKKSRSTLEMQDRNCRPALADHDAPVADADVIFLGFPVWWYREPSIIDSFLDAYDFGGKTVVPFLNVRRERTRRGAGEDRRTGQGRDRPARGKRFKRPRARERAENLDRRPWGWNNTGEGKSP
jgi:hypothetical protein